MHRRTPSLTLALHPILTMEDLVAIEFYGDYVRIEYLKGDEKRMIHLHKEQINSLELHYARNSYMVPTDEDLNKETIKTREIRALEFNDLPLYAPEAD